MLTLLLTLQVVTAAPVPPPPASGAPWWATTLAIAGPLADGVSTYYALGQPGLREGNGFYTHLFGSNVTREEILAFKVGQAAFTGWAVHHMGKSSREQAIGTAILTAAINFGVSVWNLKQGRQARHTPVP